MVRATAACLCVLWCVSAARTQYICSSCQPLSQFGYTGMPILNAPSRAYVDTASGAGWDNPVGPCVTYPPYTGGSNWFNGAGQEQFWRFQPAPASYYSQGLASSPAYEGIAPGVGLNLTCYPQFSQPQPWTGSLQFGQPSRPFGGFRLLLRQR